MPLIGELHDVAAKIGTGIANLFEESLVACEQTPIEKTDGEFGIGGIDLIAVHGRVDGLADAELLIPEIAKKDRERLFDGELCLLVGCENQKVDVGIREEFATAVTADSDKRKFGRHPMPALTDEVVDARGSAGYSCGGVASPEELLADLVSVTLF